MKIFTVYACDKCGQEFTNDKECREHEDAHISIKTYATHKGEYDSADSVYPEFVQLEMSNGSIRIYEDTGRFIERTEKEAPVTED